jgi:hypothetical protein
MLTKVKRIKLGKQIHRRLMKRVLERRVAVPEVRRAREPADPPQNQEKPAGQRLPR